MILLLAYLTKPFTSKRSTQFVVQQSANELFLRWLIIVNETAAAENSERIVQNIRVIKLILCIYIVFYRFNRFINNNKYYNNKPVAGTKEDKIARHLHSIRWISGTIFCFV